jgi:hypothetical protein
VADQGGRVVLVVGEGNTVEQRPIRIGQSTEGRYVVTGGLDEGELGDHRGHPRVRPGRWSTRPPRPAGPETMISAVFVDRPRLAVVISVVITLAGLIAMQAIPVAQFPDIVPPQVSVTTSYPGAGADVVEATVAQPIEAQIVGVENMLYMKSTSGNRRQLTRSPSASRSAAIPTSTRSMSRTG